MVGVSTERFNEVPEIPALHRLEHRAHDRAQHPQETSREPEKKTVAASTRSSAVTPNLPFAARPDPKTVEQSNREIAALRERPGAAAAVRGSRGSIVAVPFVVDEHLWAVVMSGSRESGGFPAERVAAGRVGALVATATTPTTSSPIGEELEHRRCCNEAWLSHKSRTL